jgi:hypothetical protein
MQHRRSYKWIFPSLTAVVVIGGLVKLMTTDIPAPQHEVEKPLDAKALLEKH